MRMTDFQNILLKFLSAWENKKSYQKIVTSKEVAIFACKLKKIKHIVLQIINIIRLQRKNATILIRMLHFYLHFIYRMAFQELNPQE